MGDMEHGYSPYGCEIPKSGIREDRMKQYRIWICLLAKRLWRQPVYLGLLVLILVLGYAAGIMERAGGGGAEVAVCVEDGTWSREIITRLTEQEDDSVLQFVFCADRAQVRQCVAVEEADCGFVIGEDIEDRVSDGDWRKTITVYETDSSSITGIAKERIAGEIFRLYSEKCYENYMGQISEKAVDFALEAYEEHLTDGSTFGFHYTYDDSNGQFVPDTAVRSDNAVNAAVFPVKGVFAVLIFVGGMCGMLEYEKDRKEKRFLRMAPGILTYAVDVWISTVFISAAVLLCLWLSDGIRSCGEALSPGRIVSVWSVRMWGEQIIHLLAYQCVIVLYCIILRMFVRRQETVAAAIPVLTLGSLICAPVFIRLGMYLPLFAVLEKLFPVSYYLML